MKTPASCTCGKKLYASKHAARKAHSSASWRVRVYACPDGHGGWHASNGEKAIRRGARIEGVD